MNDRSFQYCNKTLRNIRNAILSALIGIAVGLAPAQSQDLHSSQEYAAAPLFHPAATGRFDGFYRIGAVYRDQWRTVPASFQTLGVFGDMNFPLKPKRNANRFGIGILLSGDQAGDGRLRTTEFGLQSAYHQQLSRGGRTMLSVGAGINVGSKRVDIQRLIFNNQWNGESFDPLLSNGENFSGLRATYLDAQAGLALFTRTNLHDYLYFDASLHHLNQAQVSFLDASEALGLRPVVAVGGRFGLRGTTAILPRAQFSTEKNARQVVVGTNLSWGLDYQTDGDQLIAGIWYRYTDAVIVNVGARLGDVQVILSYDLNASGLTPASNGYGAAEISLVYVGRRKDRRLDCPNNF